MDNTTNAAETKETKKINGGVQLTLMNLEKEVTEFKKRLPDLSKSKRRYKDTKLSAEIVTVIKKALENYKTKELEKERVSALELLTQTDDCFLILYARNKRIRNRVRKSAKSAKSAKSKKV